MQRQSLMPQQTLAAGVFVGALLCGVVTAAVPPHARADVVAYLVNVTVRPGYNFANADAALSYGHGLCEKVSRGRPYAQTTDDGMAVDGGRSNTTVTSSPRALVMAHPSSLSTSITIARWRSRHQPSGRLPITFIPSTIHRTPHGTTAPPHRVCRRRLCVCRTTTICAFGASSALAGTSGNAPARIALPKPQGR